MTPPDPKQSSCTVNLLIHAAQVAYRINKDNIIDPTSQDNANLLQNIDQSGYFIKRTIAPSESQGTVRTRLAAVCLEPLDENEPIVIAFRGTKTKRDMLSDISIVSRGVVGKNFRDAAYKFYEETRKAHPNRHIILTGHSLGGNLATYVAAKAFNTNKQERTNHSLEVRTFNSAPMHSKHCGVFTKYKKFADQIVNYRVQADIVSNLPLKRYYGNTFVFPGQGVLKSHKMAAIHNLPDEIKNQRVGLGGNGKHHNQLLEKIKGIKSSYRCRVNGQYFSRFRTGMKNLKAMDNAWPDIITAINAKNYDDALIKLAELKEMVRGKVSTRLIDGLMKDTLAVKIEQQMKNAKGIDTNHKYKSTVQDIRKHEQAKESDQAELSEQNQPPSLSIK